MARQAPGASHPHWLCRSAGDVHRRCRLHRASPACFQHHCLLHYPYPAWEFSLGLSFINVFAAALILACLRPAVLLAGFFAWEPLRFLGRISYGAYIFHDLLHDLYARVVAVVVKHHPLSESIALVLTAVLAYASTIAISWLSFRFFESWFLNLKERWAPSSRAAAAGEAAPVVYTVADAQA